MKSWHLIKTYTHQTLRIVCACGWEGGAGEAWATHRKENANSKAPKGFNAKKLIYAPGTHPRTIGIDLRNRITEEKSA